MKRPLSFVALTALVLLAGCVSVDVGNAGAPHAYFRLHDTATPAQIRAEPLVGALLIQALPADALADTASIAYSRRTNEFAFYQLASWTERPVRQLPRLLKHRLETLGVAEAVGLVGEPLRADWLVTLAVETLHHDVSTPPGTARLALTIELFNRRGRTRVANQRFDASVPSQHADSAAAAAALSTTVSRVFDELVPWLENHLKREGPKGPS